ncbi:WXG100 family type VII secretion target [Krasilnikovia sp. M28-CT-15]|uniref:WXG100 family type VII secretion target n=1 Tax=Krasilnikovia sp. M28-CT-15 TaxID=3373540 RepID=UPI003876235D
MYGDPEELDRLAGQLRAHAAEVREHAADHVRQGQVARWVSSAAQSFRDRIVEDQREADRTAADLERAADLLQQHAQEVREKLALIAKFEHEVSAWFHHQVRSLRDEAEQVVDAAGRLLKRAVTEPPWSGWPIGPTNLPPSGDMRWLEVGGFMRGQGVL